MDPPQIDLCDFGLLRVLEVTDCYLRCGRRFCMLVAGLTAAYRLPCKSLG